MKKTLLEVIDKAVTKVRNRSLRDFRWFKKNYDKLFDKYGIVYLIIQKKKVIADFASIHAAMDYVRDNDLLGKCIVQFCDGTEDAYKIRLRRIV